MSAPIKRSWPKVVAKIEGADQPFMVVGRDAETLMRLVNNGAGGTVAYDFRGGPPFRLGAYVFKLRQRGLNIRTDREEHDCGWHARYVLMTPVIIHSVADAPGRGGAAND